MLTNVEKQKTTKDVVFTTSIPISFCLNDIDVNMQVGSTMTAGMAIGDCIRTDATPVFTNITAKLESDVYTVVAIDDSATISF